MSRYIDADALIQLGLQDGAYEYVSVQEIADFPTADVAPVVHGEWVVKGQEVYCSRCKKTSGYNWHGASAFSKFCPNCGAKMDLKGNE